MKKRILKSYKTFTSLILVLFSFFTLLSIFSFTYKSDATDSPITWGTKTLSVGDLTYDSNLGGFTVSSADELALFSRRIDFYQTYPIILTKDIDLGGYEWLPIGTESYPYKSTFDGQNHIIRNLNYQNDTTNAVVAGLFGYISNARIFNLVIDSGTILSSKTAGGVVGVMDKLSTLYNVMNAGVDVIGVGIGDAGGIVGKINESSSKYYITRCSNFATIVAIATYANNADAGGLVGYAVANPNGSITTSYNRGWVGAYTSNASKVANAGGLIGGFSSAGYGTIEKSYNAGTVLAGSETDGTYLGYSYVANYISYSGGLSAKYGIIRNSYNIGSVYALALAKSYDSYNKTYDYVFQMYYFQITGSEVLFTGNSLALFQSFTQKISNAKTKEAYGYGIGYGTSAQFCFSTASYEKGSLLFGYEVMATVTNRITNFFGKEVSKEVYNNLILRKEPYVSEGILGSAISTRYSGNTLNCYSTELKIIPSGWDKEIWSIDSTKNNGMPYLTNMFW